MIGSLVTEIGGTVVQIGATIKDGDGNEYELMGWSKPHSYLAEGRVFAKPVGADDIEEDEYSPSAFGLKIMEYDDR